MSEITIKSEDIPTEKKPIDTEDIKEGLKAADEYEKLKADTEKLEAMYLRNQEIKAKLEIGGRAAAGEQEKTIEQKAEEEAADILKTYT